MAQSRRDFLKSAGLVGAAAAAGGSAAVGSARAQTRAPQNVRMVPTPVLDIGYEASGDSTGFPIILLHGFPYDVRSWDGTLPPLVDAGYRVLVPYLRGYGPTRFRDTAAPRMAEQAAIAQDVAAMKDRLRDGVQIAVAPQLFPTPRELAQRVVALAEIEEGHRVLEPSAGAGDLLKALSSFRGVVAVERNQALADRLRGLASLKVHCADFLECNGELGRFDRIVMNPPFANGADIKHIEHAATMLKPGGRLVAICANGPRQQERLRPQCSEWHDLPPDTFKNSGTGVNAALVVIERA